MVQAVIGQCGAISGHFTQLIPGQEFTIPFVHRPWTDKNSKRPAFLFEQRKGIGVNIPVSVIESDHDGFFRQVFTILNGVDHPGNGLDGITIVVKIVQMFGKPLWWSRW